MDRRSKRHESSSSRSGREREERERRDRREREEREKRDRERREREEREKRDRERREREEREKRDRERREREEREKRDKERREREEREKRDRERREREEREKRDKERREREEREKRDRERRERERSDKERHARERSERERQHESKRDEEQRRRERHGREERESGGHERREREESGRKRRHESEEKRETSGQTDKRQRREAEQQFGHRLPQPSSMSQSLGSQSRQPTSSVSRASATHIPTRAVEEFQSYEESTHYTSSQPPTMMNIQRFVPPFYGQMFPPIPPPQGFPGYPYPPRHALAPPPHQPYGAQFGTHSYHQTGQPFPPPDYPPMFRPMPPPPHASMFGTQQPYHQTVAQFSILEETPPPPQPHPIGPQQSGTVAQPSSATFSLIPISAEENWYRERSVSQQLTTQVPTQSGIIDKAVFVKCVNKIGIKYCYFQASYRERKRYCVEHSVDQIHWYLYIDRILVANTDRNSFREYGQHVFVNIADNIVVNALITVSRETEKKYTIRPNSVIPFCRAGKVCYGVQLTHNTMNGLRWWWGINEVDMKTGSFEMYDSIPYENRLQFFKNTQGFKGFMLHFDAKMLLKDPARRTMGNKPFVTTLYMGGTFFMCEFGELLVYIENESKLVTLQALFDCGAIADITKWPNILLMLEELPSRTASAVWCLNYYVFEGPNRLPPNVFLRIPDRNAISYMWHWNSDDWKSGLKYVEWYQSTRDWTTRFEFETHQFTQPFAGTAKPQLEPKRLWLGTNPQNWLLEKSVFA